MKKRYLLLLPIVVLLVMGSFVIPVKAQGVSDPEGDIIGVHTWTEGGDPKIDCDWMPSNTSFFDIATIEWEDGGGDNYTVSMSLYGNANETYLDDGTVDVGIFFLINGSQFPSDVEEEQPDAHFTITSAINGTVQGNATSFEYNTLEVSGAWLIWTVNKSLAPVTPVAIANWDVIAVTMYSESTVNDTYAALDHYNFDYMEDLLTFVCTLFNLEIPGYSLIAVGVVAVITVGIIIRKKFKK